MKTSWLPAASFLALGMALGLSVAGCHSNEQDRDQLLAPGRGAPGPGTSKPKERKSSTKALTAHAERLARRWQDKGFSVVVETPFVVVGDESRSVVARRAQATVRWSVDLLKKDFFEKDPNEILEIWLFKDRDSYMHNAEAIFGDKPTTPFGYYSPSHKALIMNIATGGGTLVHEIVHPYMAANFPDCPAWFNEGMGSLFEQCKEKDGHITGLVNWRWTGLKAAIQKEALMSFQALTHTSTDQFYGTGSGLHYAQARYLLYYLQEKGLLRKYYQRFRANRKQDPTGYKTLQAVLGRKDLDQFQVEWEAWILGLRYR